MSYRHGMPVVLPEELVELSLSEAIVTLKSSKEILTLGPDDSSFEPAAESDSENENSD